MKITKKMLFSLSFLLLFISNVYSMNRDGLINEVRRLVKDTSSDVTKQRWSTGTIVDRLDMAAIDIVSKTRCLENQTFITTIAEQREYNLPTDLLVIKRVGFTTTSSSSTILVSSSPFRKIDRWTILGLDTDSSYWEDLGSGQPTKYYVLGSSICLVQKPSIVYAGTNRLKITYTMKPNTLDTSATIPFYDYPYLYPYHYILTYYVAMLCKIDEGDFSSATSIQNLYFQALQNMVTELSSKPDFIPNFSFQGWGTK